MKDVKPWHEDEAFWKTWGPFMFSEQRMANTPVETDGIISLMCIKPGAHVLDLCCGVG